MTGIRLFAAVGAVLLLAATPAGPYDIALHSTSSAPGAEGSARLLFQESPFGVAVTEDGRARYDIRITKFFRQGTTIVFSFEYDATVDGEPLITMRDG